MLLSEEIQFFFSRFPFLSHVQVFSCKILLVCRLKCPHSCFSFHFHFLVIFCSVYALVVLIFSSCCNQSSSAHFFIKSSNRFIDTSNQFWMLANPRPPSFLDIYCLSTSSLRHRYDFSCSLVHLLKFFSRPLWEWFRVNYVEDTQVVYYYHTPLIVFNTISWCFFSGSWLTASLLKSPRLFSVSWPILIMQSSGWSLFVNLFSSLQVPLPMLCGLFQAHQLQMKSPSPLYSIVFLVL